MAAVPSIGRATQVEGASVAPEASATQALYERYAGQIFGYCLHQLGSREEAEDAVQQTFLNAFRGLSRGVVPELEQAWIFKIANNVCLSRRRSSWRRGRIETPEDFQEMQDSLPAPARGGGVADELVGLQDVLEQMPESQRRAILLREWQGLSYREIADEMDLSQAAVETLIFRARRALAQGLQEPPATWRRRARRGLDLGGLAGFAKTLFAGGSAVKLGAAVVAVTAATVAATTPPSVHHLLSTPAPVRLAPTRHVAVSTTSVASTASSAPVAGHAPARASGARSTRRDVRPATHASPKPPASAASAPQTPAPAVAPPSAPDADSAPPPAPTATAPVPAPTAATHDRGKHLGQAKHAPAGSQPSPGGHGNGHAPDPRLPAAVAPASAPATDAASASAPSSPVPAADVPGNGNGRGNGKAVGKPGK